MGICGDITDQPAWAHSVDGTRPCASDYPAAAVCGCEFSMLASAQTQISDSARNVARLMSISGMPAAEAETAALKLLGPGLSRGAGFEYWRAVPGRFLSDHRIRTNE